MDKQSCKKKLKICANKEDGNTPEDKTIGKEPVKTYKVTITFVQLPENEARLKLSLIESIMKKSSHPR